MRPQRSFGWALRLICVLLKMWVFTWPGYVLSVRKINLREGFRVSKVEISKNTYTETMKLHDMTEAVRLLEKVYCSPGLNYKAIYSIMDGANKMLSEMRDNIKITLK